MIRTFNTVNKNMNILQTKQENTAANVTNVNTSGYKFQEIIQSTLETQQMINYTGGKNIDRRRELGSYVFGNEINEVYKNFAQGTLLETGLSTDFAIIGNGSSGYG